MEYYRIALDRETACAACHLHHLHHLRRHLQFYRSYVERVLVAVAEGQHGLRLCIVTKHGYLDAASSVG